MIDIKKIEMEIILNLQAQQVSKETRQRLVSLIQRKRKESQKELLDCWKEELIKELKENWEDEEHKIYVQAMLFRIENKKSDLERQTDKKCKQIKQLLL